MPTNDEQTKALVEAGQILASQIQKAFEGPDFELGDVEAALPLADKFIRLYAELSDANGT